MKQRRKGEIGGGAKAREMVGACESEEGVRESSAAEIEVGPGQGKAGEKGIMDPMRSRHRLRRTPPGKKEGGYSETTSAGGEADGEMTDAGAARQ